MANERDTEQFVVDWFKKDPLYNMIKLEFQKSSSKNISELLKNASKSWNAQWRPEFLITFPSQNSKYLIVVECKDSISDHDSGAFNKNNKININKYAVDWVLHYASFLKNDYDVIAIAVSGKEDNFRVSNFLWKQWEDIYEDKKSDNILSVNDYLKLFANETFSENLKHVDIIQKAVYLNDEFQACSVSEYMRCTIVSAILLALLDWPFIWSYNKETNSENLGKSLISWIEKVLKDRQVRNLNSMLKEYQKILNEPLFTHKNIKKNKIQTYTIEILKEIIHYIEKNVLPLMSMDESGMDVLGKFYTEFVRYAGWSGNVWLVLTPVHVASFFCDLADLTAESIIYDPCTWSWWFLVAGMKKLLSLTNNDIIKNKIRQEQLVWVESRADMFTYACSNMMFRWDGKSNIYHWDCFQKESEIINNHKCTTSFLNPPYDVWSAGQMEFIEHALRVVSPSNWMVIAIVQMSCAIKNEKELIAIKEKLLSRHTLKAVISMPDELFNPAAAVATCIMVWKAWTPNNTKTWFWYLKDDWFEKRKHKWRIDSKKKWDSIKRNFLDAYKENEEITWLSVKKLVNARDERLAEAYLETNYDEIKEDDFIKKLKQYMIFNQTQ